MIPVNSCYLDVIGRARHLSYYDQKGMNTRYGCTNGCEAMQCGQDCFATKSGENKECHCVCLDNSNNPCEGGSSCFGGDYLTDCAREFKRRPAWVCNTYASECCDTCKDFKESGPKKGLTKVDGSQCQGDAKTGCQQIINQWGGKSIWCSFKANRDQCCQSCLGW